MPGNFYGLYAYFANKSTKFLKNTEKKTILRSRFQMCLELTGCAWACHAQMPGIVGPGSTQQALAIAQGSEARMRKKNELEDYNEEPQEFAHTVI